MQWFQLCLFLIYRLSFPLPLLSLFRYLASGCDNQRRPVAEFMRVYIVFCSTCTSSLKVHFRFFIFMLVTVLCGSRAESRHYYTALGIELDNFSRQVMDMLSRQLIDLDSVSWTFSLGVTAEELRANIDWKSAFSLQQGQFDPEFQVEGVAPSTILLVRKPGLMIFHAV